MERGNDHSEALRASAQKKHSNDKRKSPSNNSNHSDLDLKENRKYRASEIVSSGLDDGSSVPLIKKTTNTSCYARP